MISKIRKLGESLANSPSLGKNHMDEIAREAGFSPWRKKFQGQIAEGTLGGVKTVLLKPETFMNLSGQSVGEAMRFFKLTPADVAVIHDEIDLAPGKLKFKQGGGHAGHNGLRSIHEHIGPDYARLRLGVGHPGRKEAVPGYVLRDFPKADEAWLPELLARIAKHAALLAKGDGPRFTTAIAAEAAPAKAPKAKPAAAPKPDAAPQAPKSKLSELLGKLKGDTP